MKAAPTSATTMIGWELHGARVNLCCASAGIGSYVRAHLGPAAGEAHETPDLVLALDWSWGSPPPARGASGAAERVGRHLEERDGRLEWSRVPGFDGLSLSACRSGSAMEVTASCRYTPRDSLAKIRYLKAGRREKKTNRTFFKLLYYAVYFPLAWHFESRRGWELLHASAVEKGGRALVLAGHGGAGKSTLALSMMADPAVRFVSDNLILHDGRRIFSLPEPVRLDASSLAAIRASGYDPTPSDLPLTAHPKPTFRVESSRQAHAADPATILLLRFAPRSFLREMAPGEMAAHLLAARDLVREVEGYRAVAAFLSLASRGDAGAGGGVPPLATSSGLAAGAKGYLMGIGSGEPVRATLERIREVFA